jgi:glycosyltransferase involved in cell wall biosynthesis
VGKAIASLETSCPTGRAHDWADGVDLGKGYERTPSTAAHFMAQPLISVLVDTYNHERFIEQAINSVLEQDVGPKEFEVIVVDDSSVDRTPDLVRRFEPRVRLIRKVNGGQASAFNAGIPECRGEIVAFLDGDDWWAPGKLVAVADALASDPNVGLVGHGITEVYSDGREHTELLREKPRFRITSEDGAKVFRMRKSFLGTSRMTYRAEVLRKIGFVPEALTFQADEYLFTLAGLYADILILRESLTFYRLHEQNAFQMAGESADAIRRKQRVLSALANSLREELRRRELPDAVARIMVDWIQTDADLLRLTIDGGFPWETVRAELQNYGVEHSHAGLAHWLFKCASLLPACVLPPRTYYSLKRRLAASDLYRRARGKWLPYLAPQHVDRYRTMRP